MMARTEHGTTEPAVVNVIAGNVVDRKELVGFFENYFAACEKRTQTERVHDLLDKERCIHARLFRLFENDVLSYPSALPCQLNDAHERLLDVNDFLSDEAAGFPHDDDYPS